MSHAADVNLDVDQNADFGVQVLWLDPALTPYKLSSPMRMEIRSLDMTRVVHTLSTGSGITFAAVGGLIQLIIPAATTNTLPVGAYIYDLYVTYYETDTATRVRRLMKGQLTVNKKVTATV